MCVGGVVRERAEGEEGKEKQEGGLLPITLSRSGPMEKDRALACANK